MATRPLAPWLAWAFACGCAGIACLARAQSEPAGEAGARAGAPAAIAAPSIGTFPIRFSVAEVDGQGVVEGAWLEEQLAWANRIFEPHGIQFALAGTRPLRIRTRLEDRADRHALGADIERGVINVFVVASLRDVDEPGRMRMGVHWRPEGYPGQHLVIVSASAMPTVLAHELGHFFGNPRHSEVPGNIMSYERGEGTPVFDADQVRRLRRHGQRFVRTREVVLSRSGQPTSR